MLFKKDIHQKYQLDYPEHTERLSTFKAKVIKVVNELSREQVYHDDDWIRAIDQLLAKTELDQIRFDNSSDYSKVFEESVNNTDHFLYLTGLLLDASRLNGLGLDISTEEKLYMLLQMFHRLNLNFTFDSSTYEFKNLMDLGTIAVTNDNLKHIREKENEANLLSYKSCIDDFLKVSKKDPDSYYEALGRMKKVFERCLGRVIKSSNGESIWLSRTDTILDAIFKDNNKEISTQRNSLEFIKKMIHHDQEDTAGNPTPYKFNQSEFIYWWLEINKYIYLLNNK